MFIDKKHEKIEYLIAGNDVVLQNMIGGIFFGTPWVYSTIALAKSAMERIPLHSWEMEFSIQYHMTINSQLNDQNSNIRHYINSYVL
jgi:hypothetical protein